MHRFPIALHPIRRKTYGSNDSGQVLALPPNRRASNPARQFRRGCPFRQALRDFAGTAHRASHGPRSSTKIFFENTTGLRSSRKLTDLLRAMRRRARHLAQTEDTFADAEPAGPERSR